MLMICIKTFSILSAGNWKAIVALCFLLVLSATLDILSVMSILPFIAVATDKNNGRELKYVTTLSEFLSPSSNDELVAYLGILSLSIICLAAVVGLTARYALLKFSHSSGSHLSDKLLKNYLSRGYDFFLNRNAASLSESVIGDSEIIATRVFIGIMIAFANAAITLGTLIVLLFIAPMMAIASIVVIATLYGFIYALIRQNMLSVAYLRKAASEQQTKTLRNVLTGIQDVKCFGAEDEFAGRIAKYSEQKASANARALFLGELPRKIVEAIAIGGAFVAILLMASARSIDQNLIPIIALFAFAAYKILPSTQQIYQQLARVRFYAPTVVFIYNELNTQANSIKAAPRLHQNDSRQIHLNQELSLRNVSYTFAKSSGFFAVKNLNLNIFAGELVAFVGASGAGKSTLAKILTGLLQPSTGQIYIDGIALREHNLSHWQKSVGYVSQQITLLDDTVANNIAFGQREPDLDKIKTVARIAQIHNFIELQLPNEYQTHIGDNGVRLSGG